MFFTIVNRLLQAVATLLVLSLLAFAGVYAVGDPLLLLIDPEASSIEIEAMRRNLGLDQPLPYQYLYFPGNVVTGDFGSSFASVEPPLPLDRKGTRLNSSN